MSFQFRNKHYKVDEVVDTVLDKVSDPGFEAWCNGKIDAAVSKVQEPDWESNAVRAYGRDYFEELWEKQLSSAKKGAVTGCINKAFGEVIGGGCTNNPFAPESVDGIDREVIENTLTRIRGIRKRSVQRAWSKR